MFLHGTKSLPCAVFELRQFMSSAQTSIGRLSSCQRVTSPLACKSEQQHVVILVQKKGLSQLDQHNMWFSWYEMRAWLNSISITCGDPGTK